MTGTEGRKREINRKNKRRGKKINLFSGCIKKGSEWKIKIMTGIEGREKETRRIKH